jgi:hypothetical protein
MDQSEYYRSHLPRCLASFRATPANVPDWHFDGHGSLSEFKAKFPGKQIQAPEHINTVFQMSCKCGSDSFFVFAYAWNNPKAPGQFVFLSPISLQCETCKASAELFDCAVHGHDAEYGNSPPSMRAEGKREEVECGGCDLNKVLQVFVRFEYPDDLLRADFKELDGRQQDFFTWFSLLGKCTKCSSLLPIGEYECA